MARTVGIGHQDFEKVRVSNNFYVDKTHFISEWWSSGDEVTLITRPRRFGKTLNMSMLENSFLSAIKTEETCSRDFPYGRKRNTAVCRESIRCCS